MLELKVQATDMRESIIRQKKESEEQMHEKKTKDAEEERRRHKQQEYLMKKLKEIGISENKKKVERIKENEDLNCSKLKDFQNSRVSLSKNNYKAKLSRTIEDKDRADQALERLKY